MGRNNFTLSGGVFNLGSLKTTNIALIDKWWWKFKSETNSLWVKVILSIYRTSAGLAIDDIPLNDSYKSIWKHIIITGTNIEGTGLPFRNFFVKEIGDGASTSFWKEPLVGNENLKSKFMRLSRIETILEASIQDRFSWDGIKCVGQWSWQRTPSGPGRMMSCNK
ncbi:uncharacterized protein [Rutidosis leptorrhynchoides]|uniref:uncharacterized protein n=1 Tax=Rutidosis leptorrhynchoides TaxID=125765 RepID=UPI003A9933BF